MINISLTPEQVYEFMGFLRWKEDDLKRQIYNSKELLNIFQEAIKKQEKQSYENSKG